MGTSSAILFIRADKKDHPHAYGDKASSSADGFRVPGSSPRVWGQVYPKDVKAYNFRIIPTRMGTSVPGKDIFNVQQDHPHAYGDKLYHRIFDLSRGGSSPRVWGQVVDDYYIHNDSGIIPTRMGTSTSKLQK